MFLPRRSSGRDEPGKAPLATLYPSRDGLPEQSPSLPTSSCSPGGSPDRDGLRIVQQSCAATPMGNALHGEAHERQNDANAQTQGRPNQKGRLGMEDPGGGESHDRWIQGVKQRASIMKRLRLLKKAKKVVVHELNGELREISPADAMSGLESGTLSSTSFNMAIVDNAVDPDDRVMFMMYRLGDRVDPAG